MIISQPLDVAICGEGLAGLGLAIALQSKGIECAVYEAAARPTQVVKSALSLGPNGENVLYSLGIMPELAEQACFYRDMDVKTLNGDTVSKILMSYTDHFKHDGMRVTRAQLIDVLVKTARDRNIPVICSRKYTRVLSESVTNGVHFEFEDGSTATASLLVGADGIHSRMRTNMYPDTKPQYIGFAAVLATCDA